MPSNFKAPQLEQARIIAPQVGKASTQDNAAHNKANSISRNIDLLNNIANKGIKIMTESEQAQNINEARRATAGMPDYINNKVRLLAETDGKEFRKLSNAELNAYSKQAEGEFYDENGINDSSYKNEAYRLGNELGIRTLGKLNGIRNKENLSFNTELISDRTNTAANILKDGSITPESFAATLSNDLELDSVAVGNEATAKGAQLQGLIQNATQSGNPELVKILKSNEAKDYFNDVPKYNKLVQVAENKSRAAVNSRSQLNFKTIENEAFMLKDQHVFKTSNEVDNFLKEKLAETDPMYAPSNKSISKLRASLYKDVGTSLSLVDYQKEVNVNHNSTVLTGLKKKDAEALITADAMQEIGVVDFSDASIGDILSDEIKSSALTSYMASGKPVPEQLRNWAKKTPVGGLQGLTNKYINYGKLNSKTEGRINDIFDKKSQAEMMFMGKLLDNDAIEETAKHNAFIEYKNDVDRNVDSFGNYYSKDAAAILQDEDVLADIQDFAKDAPWTIDDNVDSVYISRQVKGNLGIYVAAGFTPDEALKQAKKVYNRTHTSIELPNGEEGIITPEFSAEGANEKKMTEYVMNKPSVRKYLDTIQTAANLRPTQANLLTEMLAEDLDLTDDISYRPTPQYEKTKEYQVFFRGTIIEGSRFRPEHYKAASAEIEQRKKDKTLLEFNESRANQGL